MYKIFGLGVYFNSEWEKWNKCVLGFEFFLKYKF